MSLITRLPGLSRTALRVARLREPQKAWKPDANARRRNAAAFSSAGKASHCIGSKLQALVYDILPSTTAVFSYAIGS